MAKFNNTPRMFVIGYRVESSGKIMAADFKATSIIDARAQFGRVDYLKGCTILNCSEFGKRGRTEAICDAIQQASQERV